MIDLKKATEIAKRFIVPTLVALLILGMPLGYQYYKLQKERSALADLQVDLKKKKAELEAKSASREAELDKKAKTLSEKEAGLISMANQLKKSLTSLDQREQEYQTALAKLQQEQILASQKAKQKPLKRAAIQQPKPATLKQAPLKRAMELYPIKRPSYSKSFKKKPVTPKEYHPAEVIPPPIAPPPVATPPIVKLEESLPQARPPGACASVDGGADATREMTRLKRKISATSFNINYRPIALTPNIRSGFPEELLRRLGEGDEFLPRNSSLGIGYPPLKAQPDSLSGADAAREVAFKTGSQFILSGVIDAGIGRSDYGRWVEVEVDAYDGLTGVVVTKRRQGMEIADENEIEIRSQFGSAKYFSTPFGKRLDALMQSLIKGIRTDLACMPFTAKITDIDIDNNKIYIDGGAASRVAPGDKFVAYHSAKRIQSESATNGLLGAQTIPVASLTIRQVSPLFSIGELSIDPKKAELHVGDIVSAQKVHLEKQK